MKFVYKLIRVFRFFGYAGLNFRENFLINIAKSDSGAILDFFAFILIPKPRKTLQKICRFIAYKWAENLFNNQT